MGTEKQKKEKKEKTIARHVLLFFLLVFFAFLIRIISTGLPQPLVNALSEAVSTVNVSVEFEGVSLSLLRWEIKVTSAEIYQKKIVGNAIAKINDATIKISPKLNTRLLTWVKEIKIRELYVPAADKFKVGSDTRAVHSVIDDFDSIDVFCSRSSILGFKSEDLRATASSANGLLQLNDIRVGTMGKNKNEPHVHGALSFNLKDFSLKANASGSIDPNELLPIFKASGAHYTATEIARFQFLNALPILNFNIEFSPSKPKRLLELDISLNNCLYNGVHLKTGNGFLHVYGSNSWDNVSINPIAVTRPEGAAQGNLFINSEENWLSFQATSTFDPVHLIRLVRIYEKPFELPVTLSHPTLIEASGLYDMSKNTEKSDKTRITGTASLPAISYNGFKFENLQSSMQFDGTTLSITNVTAEVLEGRANGFGELTFDVANNYDTAMNVDVKFSKVSYMSFASVLNQKTENPEAIIDLELSFKGPVVTNANEFVDGLTGNAKLNVSEACIYRIPLFAGMTKLIAENVPGIDFFIEQNDLSAKIIFENSTVKISALNISGNVFSASGYGTIDLDGELNLLIKGHLLDKKTLLGRGIHYLLLPVSKILEVQATGNISNPKWSSATLSGKPAPKK